MKRTQTYSKEQLIEQIDCGAEVDFLLFDGHKESVDGSVLAACCSQWFPAVFSQYPSIFPFFLNNQRIVHTAFIYEVQSDYQRLR